jgi:hypothetical protein
MPHLLDRRIEPDVASGSRPPSEETGDALKEQILEDERRHTESGSQLGEHGRFAGDRLDVPRGEKVRPGTTGECAACRLW